MTSAIPGSAVGRMGALSPGGLLQEVLGSLIVTGGANVLGAMTGALEAPPPQGTSGSKYMITLQDVKEIEKFVAGENLRRSVLNRMGANLPPLDAQDIIAEREAQLRISAEQAGAREYAKEQLSVPAATIPAMAQAAGVGAAAQSQLGQQFLESFLARPNIDPAIQEAARGL